MYFENYLIKKKAFIMLHDKQTNKYELYKSCDGILN